MKRKLKRRTAGDEELQHVDRLREEAFRKGLEIGRAQGRQTGFASGVKVSSMDLVEFDGGLPGAPNKYEKEIYAHQRFAMWDDTDAYSPEFDSATYLMFLSDFPMQISMVRTMSPTADFVCIYSQTLGTFHATTLLGALDDAIYLVIHKRIWIPKDSKQIQRIRTLGEALRREISARN